ncbi:hypothetical protein B9G55_22600 [Saccharibacillus sp. O16]|nr:hypothetical protein B9G55_22600 [Saccharibacillus sp. O16]
MIETAEQRLKNLGILLPEGSMPAAAYANAVIVNGLMFVAGKGPSGAPQGKLGREYSTEQGFEFARQTGIEILAVLKSELGSLDRFKRVIKFQGFVNATEDFKEHHKVLDGCSKLMIDVFGGRGSHARSVFGAVSVRDDLPIIVDSIFEVE